MNKLILLLLFIPLVSFSQISYKDIMSINSVDQCKRVMIENGYEFNEIDDDGWISYGLNIVRDSIDGNRSTSWSSIHPKDNRWSIRFVRTTLLEDLLGGGGGDKSEYPYDLIVKDIKEKCKYYKILNYKGDDYVSYSCSESSYKGKIGFVIIEDFGIIRHFPKE